MSVETEIPCSAERKEMTFPIQNVSDYPTEFPEIHTLPSRRVSRPSHFRSLSAHNRPRFLPLRFSYNSTGKPPAATTRHHPPVFLRTGVPPHTQQKQDGASRIWSDGGCLVSWWPWWNITQRQGVNEGKILLRKHRQRLQQRPSESFTGAFVGENHEWRLPRK